MNDCFAKGDKTPADLLVSGFAMGATMKNRDRHRAFAVSPFEKLEDRRLLAAGALDPSFSGDGKATINIGGKVVMQTDDVAVQSDGKTVIVGQARSTPSSQTFKFAVARLNLDGSPDTTFGTNGTGIVTTNVGDKNFDTPSAVAIQGDGKIVVVGFSQVGTLVSSPTRFGVARFNTNGTLDKTFDGDGKRTIDFRGYAEDVIIQRVATTKGIVEKIVVVGTNDDGTIFTPTNNFAIARLNPDGKLDTTFSGDGKNQFGLGSDSESAQAVAIDSAGRIVLGGYSGKKFALMRVLGSNGAKDTSFLDPAITAFPGQTFSYIEDLLIQSGNRIVAAGRVSIGGNLNFALARYNADGKRDLKFGGTSNGLVVTDFGGNDQAFGLIQSADGGLIVAGSSNGRFALASYTADGVPRTTFGAGGKLITDFPAGSGSGGAAGIAKGPGRRFVVAGGTPFRAARYLDTGANVVSVGSFDRSAAEGPSNNASLIVGRTERLPTPTRVFFSIGGTAKFNNFFGSDYQLSGMTVPTSGKDLRPFVDIPANQTFTTVTIAPINDIAVEGLETATFSIVPVSSYEIGTPGSATINIADNDGTLLNATADAYVRDGASAGTNFGAAPQLEVKKASSGFNRQTFLKFHIDTLSTINTAKLRLFGRLTAADGAGIATSVFGSSVTNWSESALNFNNKPATTGSALATTTITDTTARFYEWDVTAFLKAQKAAGKTVVTLVLTNLVNSSQFVTFNSREAGNGPQIIVG